MSKAVDILRALADPTRLRIATLLRAMELSVGELAQVLGQSQPRVSRHVKILADAGVADRRKEGSWMFLSLGDRARVHALLDAVAGCGKDETATADLARLGAVRADRAAAAQRYFEGHAKIWDSIRSLHIAEAQVEEAVGRAIGGDRVDCLVDIGTGTGRMLALFGGAAGQAIGIDRSSEMLRVARARLEAAGFAGSDLRQGDMYALPLRDGSADLVILHQVLHYAQVPAAAIAEAARVLTPGGRLLIVDFAAHDREELRERDAHARLGFADDAMLGWLRAAGLAAEVCEHLQGGELTVTLWRGTRPGVPVAHAKAA